MTFSPTIYYLPFTIYYLRMDENKAQIVRSTPGAAIPGAEVLIECEGFDEVETRYWNCTVGDEECRLVGASKRRILAIVPGDLLAGEHRLGVEIGDLTANNASLIVGTELADELHPVANPAFDPDDGSLFVTRSGSRGQEMPVSIFRITPDGELDGFSGDITNPTGIAFNSAGNLFVTSRLTGIVYRVDDFKEATPFAEDLGVATGLAFNKTGDLFVGNRSGVIYRISPDGEASSWATHEPSVSAYHLAFGTDGMLYVTGPTVSSYDAIVRFDQWGKSSVFFRGLGRPQGLAFDVDGNLYVAASYRGRRGIIRITPDGQHAELAVSGMNIVGLCFSAEGDIVVATTNAVYSVPVGIKGLLLA